MRRVIWVTGTLVAGASAGAIAALGPIGCSSSSGNPVATVVPEASVEDLKDPQSCQHCHPLAYGDWAKSMHAFASKDPVFRAMNARGQRETDGGLGSFCVQCHAPMAFKDGLTQDGMNLDSLPDKEKNVTCYFCHNIDAVGQSHVNADVHLANDTTMRGPLKNPGPVANVFHGSAYAGFQDDMDRDASPNMCGSCHDITTPAGAHIEATYSEYQTTVFAGNTSCAATGNCHMNTPAMDQHIATNGPLRQYHQHDFPAVDVANDPTFPAMAAQVASVTSALADAVSGAVCVSQAPGGTAANVNGPNHGIRVLIDAQGTGHNFPSGAAQDRRVWVDVVAEKNGQPFYASGQIPAGGVVQATVADPDIWVLRDQMFDANDREVSMFWQAACRGGNELKQVQAPTPTMPSPSVHQLWWYPHQGDISNQFLSQGPDKVTVRVHMQAIGADVLADLVDSGDLAPSAAQVTTLEVGLPSPTDHTVQTLVWTPATAGAPMSDFATGLAMTCVSTNAFNITGGTILGTSPPTHCPGYDGGSVDLDAGSSQADAPSGSEPDATTADATVP